MAKWGLGEAKEPLYSRPPEQVSHAEALTLQTLMEIKESIGELKADIKSANEKISSLETKVDKIETCISTVTHKMYAAGVVLAIVLAIGGFVASKSWDIVAAEIGSNQTNTTQKDKK